MSHVLDPAARIPLHAGGTLSGMPRVHIGAALRLIATWIERSTQRAALAELDDHLLRDVGLSRREALHEAAKPFWKP
jgi:uncharacterized protein YjiS (DUF1127 family)